MEKIYCPNKYLRKNCKECNLYRYHFDENGKNKTIVCLLNPEEIADNSLELLFQHCPLVSIDEKNKLIEKIIMQYKKRTIFLPKYKTNQVVWFIEDGLIKKGIIDYILYDNENWYYQIGKNKYIENKIYKSKKALLSKAVKDFEGD